MSWGSAMWLGYLIAGPLRQRRNSPGQPAVSDINTVVLVYTTRTVLGSTGIPLVGKGSKYTRPFLSHLVLSTQASQINH